jgi:8-oxo-dGTP pyrophosphatase MutT (NUDIX family)
VIAREGIMRRLARAGSGGAERGPARGDHDLDPAGERPGALTPAAVLVALVEGGTGLTVLLTRRSEGLPEHGGEIGFPGGRIEPSDRSPEDAALREAEEELGLSRDRVEIVGRLDPYETRTGFRVCPVVGLVRPPLALRPDPVEVAEVFEVPLAHILDPGNHRRVEAPAGGRVRTFYAIPFGDRVIWGATAGMLINLYEVLGQP